MAMSSVRTHAMMARKDDRPGTCAHPSSSRERRRSGLPAGGHDTPLRETSCRRNHTRGRCALPPNACGGRGSVLNWCRIGYVHGTPPCAPGAGPENVLSVEANPEHSCRDSSAKHRTQWPSGRQR